MQEQGRPNQFMLMEAWNDEDGLETYRTTDDYRAFRTALQPVMGSPLDERRAQQVTVPKAESVPK